MTELYDQQEREESKALVQHAFDIARTLGIPTLLVQADELFDVQLIEECRRSESVLWLKKDPSVVPGSRHPNDKVIGIPATDLSRISQLNLGMFRAVLDGHVSVDESVVCLSGVAGTNRLDTLVIANPRRDFPWFREHDVTLTRAAVASREFSRIVDIALRFASEGREGRPIGTTFVLGDREELAPYLRQLVLNPCSGHPEKLRNIHSEMFVESLREFAALDGAFVLNTKGIVESAGTYLDAPGWEAGVKPGLGARHASAAAITSKTNSVAVVVSESSGTVTVFHDGETILELEKPKPLASRGT